MNRPYRLVLLFAAAVALLAGCQTQNQMSLPTAEAPAQAQLGADAACVVTSAGYQHIYARHCTPSSGASQLLPQYCTDAAAAQNFCRMVQNAPNQTRTAQPDGRVRYDSNLGIIVGTAGEKCGRLIINSPTDGTVVTEFPEFAGAPGNCK